MSLRVWDGPNFKAPKGTVRKRKLVNKGPCLECGGPCTSRDSKKYCSRACRFKRLAREQQEREAKKQKPCARCGAVLPVKSRGLVRAKTYCSRECQRLALKDRAFQSHPEMKERPCPVCATPFSPWWHGRGWTKFCSPQCLRKDWAKQTEMAFVDVVCGHCGKSFKKRKAYMRRTKASMCSEECRRAHHRGVNHPMFRPEAILDPKRRGTTGAWKTRSAEIRNRDSHQCRRCGKKWDDTMRLFQVDHVIPWRTFENKAEADHPSNLVTLCHSCHTLKTSTAERRWMKGDVQMMEQYKRDVGYYEQLARYRSSEMDV